MKSCSYCGAQYPDDTTMCAIDQTPLEQPVTHQEIPEPETIISEYKFINLSDEDRQKDLVTLMSCQTLVEADLVVSRLRVEGIQAFLPYECLVQTIGWNLNTYGYLRIQIAPKDYADACALLSEKF